MAIIPRTGRTTWRKRMTLSSTPIPPAVRLVSSSARHSAVTNRWCGMSAWMWNSFIRLAKMASARRPTINAAMPTATPTTSRLMPNSVQNRLRRTPSPLQQLVSHPAHRGDEPRAIGVVAELLPHLAHVHVDGPIDGEGLVMRVDVIQELIARKSTLRRLQQRLQQPEFHRRQADLGAIDRHAVPVQVHIERPALQRA